MIKIDQRSFDAVLGGGCGFRLVRPRFWGFRRGVRICHAGRQRKCTRIGGHAAGETGGYRKRRVFRPQWKQITQTSLKQAAWVEGRRGLAILFLTAASGVSYKYPTVEDKSAELIRLLSQHPEESKSISDRFLTQCF